jgi:C-terminal processing protease CtpA/Prc
VTFDPSELSQGRFKIASILPLGPVAVAEGKVSVGDYLLAVNGQTLDAAANVWQLLRHTVGKKVVLRVNDKAEETGAREVAVRPVHAGVTDRLVYRDWVRRSAAYVHGLSGGRLGYVHVRAMDYECYQQFVVDLDTETHDREGVVIDVRFNGGGHIASFILDVLHRKTFTLSSYRNQSVTSSTNLAGGRVLDKPTILVQNEHSGSNTEMFSEGYRRLGLGKIVGKPTMGAVIWTWGWSLLDGTWFRLPRLKVSTLEGENLEQAARPVDLDVDRPLGEAARGEDRQLRVAVETLLEQIDGE